MVAHSMEERVPELGSSKLDDASEPATKPSPQGVRQDETKADEYEVRVPGDLEYIRDARCMPVAFISFSNPSAAFRPTSKPLSIEYWPELVAHHLSTKGLPSLELTEDSLLPETLGKRIPLYSLRPGQESLEKENFSGSDGFALAMGKWSSMDRAHLEAQIRWEFADMAETKTVNDDQMERLRKQFKHLEFLETSRLSEIRNMVERKKGGDWYKEQCTELRDEIQGEYGKNQNNLRRKLNSQRENRFPSRVTLLWDALTFRTFYSRWTGRLLFTNVLALDAVEQERHNRHAVRKAELPQRLIAAVAGTACLVAPMLIMSIHQTRMKSLITASVSVLIFGIGLAVGSAVKVGELLAALAAYAAVLVVFVGVSGP